MSGALERVVVRAPGKINLSLHVGGVDAGDLFGRVEAIPRNFVIDTVEQHKTWTGAEQYVAAQ